MVTALTPLPVLGELELQEPTLIVGVVDETLIAEGPLVAGTVAVLLMAIAMLSKRGLIEIEVNLDQVTALDYQAIAELSGAQQLAGSAGRVLRMNTANPSLRVALTGCHLDAESLGNSRLSSESTVSPALLTDRTRA